MQRDEIGICQQIVQLIDELDLQTARPRCREIWIVSEHAHAKSDRTPAQFAADPPQADDTEGFVVKFDAFEIFAVPILLAHARVGLRNSSCDRKQKRKGMFGGGNGVSAGRIEHDNSASGRGFNIDIVYADPGATDYAQTRSGIQDLGGDFRFAAHDDGAELRDKIDNVMRLRR